LRELKTIFTQQKTYLSLTEVHLSGPPKFDEENDDDEEIT
jgi:hypothetical protein